MKRISFICLTVVLFAACNSDPEHKIRKEAMSVAEDYIKGHRKVPETKIDDKGIVSIPAGETTYILDPSLLFTGLLDNDKRQDAILTVYSYFHGQPRTIEHLFMINVDGKLIMQRAIENDMKILELKDGIITAEIHTHPKSSPLYDCPVCMEAVKYRYVAGELVKVE